MDLLDQMLSLVASVASLVAAVSVSLILLAVVVWAICVVLWPFWFLLQRVFVAVRGALRFVGLMKRPRETWEGSYSGGGRGGGRHLAYGDHDAHDLEQIAVDHFSD